MTLFGLGKDNSDIFQCYSVDGRTHYGPRESCCSFDLGKASFLRRLPQSHQNMTYDPKLS